VSNAQILILTLLVMSFFMGFLSLVVARGIQHGEFRQAQALRTWGWGTLCYAFGMLVTQLPSLPREFTSPLGNSLIAVAPLVCAQAALTYTDRRLDARWTYPLVGLVVCALFLAHLTGWQRTLVSYNAPTVVAVVTFTVAAYVLLVRPVEDAPSASRFLAGVMFFAVFVWVLRTLFLISAFRRVNDVQSVDTVIALFAIAQLVAATGSMLGMFWVEVQRTQVALRKLALTDALTKVPNRRAVIERFAQVRARHARVGEHFAMMVIDIDHFKLINDRYGHQTGDLVLAHLARTLTDGKRADDELARLGGEEFVILLQSIELGAALSLAERLRARVAATPFPMDQAALDIRFSAGVAIFPFDGSTWDELFAKADQRCYQAKADGRDRIVGPPLSNTYGRLAVVRQATTAAVASSTEAIKNGNPGA
jgi:diguanylate cyclase (GGDEF)-like protein